MKYTYLSFADTNGFLGGLLFPGELTIDEAIRMAWFLKLNPGGEVCYQVSHPVSKREEKVLNNYVGRLLTKEDINNLDRQMNDVRQ